MMRITFVGSSHGVPEPNRKCSCIMIEVGDRIYFIDMGTSAIETLRTRGMPVESVKAVFISHMHGDHTNGLIPFIDLITWYFKTATPAVFLPTLSAVNIINDWLKVTLNHQEKQVDYHLVESGLLYDDGIIKVHAIPTKHCPNSYAYLVKTADRTVLFTSDLRGPEVDFPNVARDTKLDLLVCEGAHFPATEYLPVLENYDEVSKVCVTHYSDFFMDSLLQMRRTLQEHGIPVVLATDGLELTL